MSISSSRAVSMMIGTCEVARTRRQTSSPSIPGSITSSRIRSGRSAPTVSSASSPSTAVDDAVALALEREGQHSLHGLLVVDDENRRLRRLVAPRVRRSSSASQLSLPARERPGLRHTRCHMAPAASARQGRRRGRPATARRGARPVAPAHANRSSTGRSTARAGSPCSSGAAPAARRADGRDAAGRRRCPRRSTAARRSARRDQLATRTRTARPAAAAPSGPRRSVEQSLPGARA